MRHSICGRLLLLAAIAGYVSSAVADQPKDAGVEGAIAEKAGADEAADKVIEPPAKPLLGLFRAMGRSLFDAFRGPEPGPHPLLGEKAPQFKLDEVGAKQVLLTQHANKDIVILDFWATWCGPCHAAMPKLAKVAKQYKGKGVVLYGINIEEDEETIKEFLKQQEFDIRVLRDADGTASTSYQIEGIPQMVLIGKDGVVHSVHLGMASDLEKRLTDEIESLLKARI